MGVSSRREFLRAGVISGLGLGVATGCARMPLRTAAQKARKHNVLFIAVDDLRPELGCYGVAAAKTPNIDALASKGTVFTRAYCQQAVCNPSRASLMTGLRPDTIQVHDLQTHFRLNRPETVTLSEHFKNNGYHSQGFGKIYHGGLNDPLSWSVPHTGASEPAYVNPDTLAALAQEREKNRAAGKRMAAEVLERDPETGAVLKVKRASTRVRGPAWECEDVPDNAYPDGMTTERALDALRKLRGEQFFLAVGYHRPHLPFNAPKKYFDMYPPGSLSNADNPFAPKDVPAMALSDWGELRAYKGIPKSGPLSDDVALQLVHAYHACCSYTDAQIGKLLAELDRLGLRDNTVVVLWGDHGWHLGEHGSWCKHTNFEIATRVPMIVSSPSQSAPGSKSDALVEFVDIYPTLCDLCGLNILPELEGLSVAPLLNDPNRPWKTAAFSQYPRPGGVMGYTMRTERYRYTEWIKEKTDLVGVELYDHILDPDENVNRAKEPEQEELIKQLSATLHAGWKAALPPSQ